MSRQYGCFAKMRFAGLVTAGLLLAAVGSVYGQAPVAPPGSGTAGSPYLISQLGHLVWMGNNAGASSGKYYSLTADIDASATAGWNDTGTGTDVLEGFKAIGTGSSTSFRGVFEGNGHAISGMVINRPATDYVGLFGYVGSPGRVQNLGLVGGAVTGKNYVGGLVGRNSSGTASNCYATGEVTGLMCVGGLVGYNSFGTISNCHATGAVTGTGVSNYVGGLVGYIDSGTVSNCYATGAVMGTGSYVGGLVGYRDSGTVSNSYWDMQTSGQSTSARGTGKTTAQMKQQATFAGWDFTTVWSIVEGTSYPYLLLSPPPFKLTVSITGPGGVTIDPPSANGTYALGTVVTLTAVPGAPTDEFIRWMGAAPSESPTVTVVMDIHRSVAAVFRPRIEISSLADLAKIGNDPGYPLVDVRYVLTADIDASATAGWNDAGTGTDVLEGFKPIGTYSSPDTTSFRGVFDGNGHTISGLVVNRQATNYVGLFACVGVGGQVRNLGLVGGAVTGKQNVGSLVGYNSYGTVSNCRAAGGVTGSSCVGGLAGSNTGTVSNCYATDAVTGPNCLGGLVGWNEGTVSNCYAVGAVTGSSDLGGLVGYNSSGTVSNCYATGAVTGTGDGSDVGGLVGYNRTGTISKCFANGAVTGTGSFLGGLVGDKYFGTVSNSYWDMQTSGRSNSAAGTGKTTIQMKQQATFTGWDFTGLWGIVEGTGYPYLRFWPPPFKLTVNISGHGDVTVDPPSADGTYAPGTLATLTAVSDGSTAGFARWEGATPGRSPTVAVVMDIHRSVTAVFARRIDINSLANLAKIGNDAGYPLLDVLYVLMADIDASDTAGWNDAGTSTDVLEGFKPIGTYSSPDTTSFRGVFDGNGHTISGLVVNRPATSYAGLFGYVGATGHVRNLGMVGGAVAGKDHVGGLVGSTFYGTVSNCYANGAVTGTGGYVGGLVGRNFLGTISDSYANGAGTGTGTCVGGLVGDNSGTISNCYANGAVTGTGSYVGGLAGSNFGPVSNSYWDMLTSGRSTSGGGTGKTTTEMKQQATFASWDFTSIWGIVEGTSYPHLRFSPSPFKLTVNISGPGGVTVDPLSADGTYVPGTLVTLTAVPDGSTAGFIRWAGAAPSESPTVTVVMDIHKSVTAVFGSRIEISSLADLAKIGNDPGYPLVGVVYALTADIDASATAGWNDAGTGTDVLEGFKPIGTYSSPDTTSFGAVFDGNGHTISGLVVNRSATNYVGLFGYVGSTGHVRNLGLVADAVVGKEYVGGLVGYSYYGTVSNCYATGAVAGTGDYSNVGGAVGYNNYGTISDCRAAGAVSGKQYVGGLVGRNPHGTVSNCHATGTVAGTGDYSDVGGLVGYNDYGAVSNCCATGAVTGRQYVGGLVGHNASGTVPNCCATGAVTGISYVGGLVGYNASGTISNCYASGAITGADFVGGLVGYQVSSTVSNSYWDMQTSGQNTSRAGTGKTTAQMKQQATFTAWDFTGVWGIVEGTCYPYLRLSPSPFKLTVNISGRGSVTVDPPSTNGTYAPGTVVTLTAAPDGSTDAFIRWMGAVPSESSTITVVMDIHRSVTATFGPRIEVNSLADLAKIGNDPGYPLVDVLYVLTADIDASATAGWNDGGTGTDVLEGFKPIGTYSSLGKTSFRGVFDGNGHTISGLVINRPATSYVGLFGCVGIGGHVRNLGMAGGEVTGGSCVGELVGYNLYSGTVSDCYATGAVTGSYSAGGLVGYNEYSGAVSNCYAAGAVTGNEYVGGLVGRNGDSTVSNCRATGTVTGKEFVGGLVGHHDYGTVSSCCASGTVTGLGKAGGLVGYHESGTVSDCSASGAVTGSSYVGGLVGHHDYGAVLNCYAIGAVTGKDYVGGLVGYNVDGTVSNCYAIGAITGSSWVGGLIGANVYCTISNSYWDTQTSGQSTSGRGTGEATPEMKLQATFTGWDFTDVWGIVEGSSYPYLRFSPPPFKLTIKTSGPGSVTIAPPSADGMYTPGTVVTLTAMPDGATAGFIRWEGAAPSESATVTVIMDIHRSVTAMFLPKIEIGSLADLARIGNDPGYPLVGVLYVLTADIDASATAGWNDTGTGTDVLEGFKPIGTYSSPDTTSFRGIFHGNGHTISGLVVNRPATTGSVGLFGCVGVGGLVRNLGLVGGAVTGRNCVGGLAGYNYGTASDCYATDAVTGSSYVGGLVGYNSSGTVSSCYATGVVTGSGSVGGLVGYQPSGTVSNSYWDKQTSGRNTSAGGTGKTTAEMKQRATFAGWDFAGLWGITENVTYPFLRSLVLADFDRDRDVDMADFLGFKACFNGPNRRPKADCAVAADLDGDTDVDLIDFAIFRACFNGSNSPPSCP